MRVEPVRFNLSRRGFLAGSAIALTSSQAMSATPSCTLTAEQEEGPYYIDYETMRPKLEAAVQQQLGFEEFALYVADMRFEGTMHPLAKRRLVGSVGAAWEFGRSGAGWTQRGTKLTGAGEIGPREIRAREHRRRGHRGFRSALGDWSAENRPRRPRRIG